MKLNKTKKNQLIQNASCNTHLRKILQAAKTVTAAIEVGEKEGGNEVKKVYEKLQLGLRRKTQFESRLLKKWIM